MSEGFHYEPWVNALSEQQRRCGVAQIVEPNLRQLREFGETLKTMIQVARFNRGSDTAGEHKAPFLPAIASKRPFLGLFGATLRANIVETLTAAIITEQGGKENHRERSQDCYSFRNQFA